MSMFPPESDRLIAAINERSRVALNQALIGMIEEADGRVPTGEEIQKYGLHIQVVGAAEDPEAFPHFFIWKNQHVLGWCVEIHGGFEGVDLGHGFVFVSQRLFPDDQPFAVREVMKNRRDTGFYG